MIGSRFISENHRKNMLLIAFLALVVRLIILPWSQTVHADAGSRILIALGWLTNPHYITDGYWGPLHHYLNAFFLWLFPGWVIGPKALNITLATLTVLPLYGFTRNLFSNTKGAFFVALAYAFSPLVVRNSFQALAGVSYAFFVVSSMYFLSEGLKKGDLRNAAFAGLAITLAAATRYEAWVIIAAFTLVGLLHKQFKFTTVFWLAAMLFPGTWMIGNQLEFGDFLYSVNQNDVWNIQMEGINDKVDSVKLIERIVFFPMSFMLIVSPIATVLLLFGLGWAILKKKLSKEQVIWIVPFLVMAAIFVQKAYVGTLMMQHRFTLTWMILLLPFLALVFIHPKWQNAKSILLIVSVLTAIPLSFTWVYWQHTKYLGQTNLAFALDELTIGMSHEIEAIPLLRSEVTEQLVAEIKKNSIPNHGLILDFMGWDKTCYTATRSEISSYQTNGAKYGEIDFQSLNDFLNENPKGQIVFFQLGKLNEKTSIRDSIFGWEELNRWFVADEVWTAPGLKLFNYREISTGEAEQIGMNEMAQIGFFDMTHDAAFFEQKIRFDKSWFTKVRRRSFWDWETMETTMKKNTDYMIEEENQKK